MGGIHGSSVAAIGRNMVAGPGTVYTFSTDPDPVSGSMLENQVSRLVVGRLTENRTETAVFKKPKTEPTSV